MLGSQATLHCVRHAKSKPALQFAQAAVTVMLKRDLSTKYRLYDRLTPEDRYSLQWTPTTRRQFTQGVPTGYERVPCSLTTGAWHSQRH